MNIPLVLAVIVVSGVVAYVGDVIGKRLGKKRVSIFGLRPRQTAVVIAVLTGCVITVVTMAALAVASRDVREAIFRIQQLRDEARQADEERNAALAGQAEARGDLSAARSELLSAESGLSQAHTDLTAAETSRDEARAHAEGALAQAGQAEAEVARTQGELGQAAAEVAGMRKTQESLAEEIKRIEEDKKAVERTRDELLLETGKQYFEASLPFFGYSRTTPRDRRALEPEVELARAVVPARSDGGMVRRALDSLLEDASTAAASAGCKPYDDPGDQRDCTTGLMLILLDAELKPGPEWHFMDLPERTNAYDQFLNRMADRIAELSARGDVYVEVNVGSYAVPRSRPALVEFDLGLVESAHLPVGYVLAVLPVPKNAGRNDAASACRQLITKARTEARWGDHTGTGEYRGVIRPELIREPSYEEIEAAVAEIARLQGEMHLDARLAAVIVPPPGAETANYTNIDVPNYRIDVDPVL